MSSITAISSTSPTVADTSVSSSLIKRESPFSQILSDTLEKELQEKTLTLTAQSSPDGVYNSSLSQSGTAEQILMNAMKTGESSDAQSALFMMCMMMESSSDNAEMSSILGMMSTLLSGIQGDTSEIKNEVLKSDYSPFTLSMIDSSVFGSFTPKVSTTGSAIVPSQAWKPTSPAVVSNTGDRSPEKLRQVIDQFNVETSTRYQPYRQGNDTYCNIFLWDVTSALNCEIPHFVDPATGAPRQYPDIQGAVELGAVDTEKWLVKHGPSYGWHEVNALTAQNYANQGKPAVTTAGDIGHVQVVCPSAEGGFDPIRGVSVAQSGSRNTAYTNLSSIYGSSSRSKVRYFVHE